MSFLRKFRLFALVGISVIGCDSRQIRPIREKEFWEWFQANEQKLYYVKRDQEHTFDLLQSALGKVDKNLTFAFGPVENGRRESIVTQCGYCQSGQLMSSAVLLQQKPNPTDKDVDLAFARNICRYGTFSWIRRAVHRRPN